MRPFTLLLLSLLSRIQLIGLLQKVNSLLNFLNASVIGHERFKEVYLTEVESRLVVTRYLKGAGQILVR